MAQINFKRGDTFTLTCTYKVDGEDATPLQEFSITPTQPRRIWA